MKTCPFCSEPHNSKSDYCSMMCSERDATNSLPDEELFNMDAFVKDMHLNGKMETPPVYWNLAKFQISTKTR